MSFSVINKSITLGPITFEYFSL